jgi:hypothetical protein
VFSKPKEQRENSKAKTSGEHGGERTTLFLLTRVSAEVPQDERGSEEGEKGRKGGKLRRKQCAGRLGNQTAQNEHEGIKNPPPPQKLFVM